MKEFPSQSKWDYGSWMMDPGYHCKANREEARNVAKPLNHNGLKLASIIGCSPQTLCFDNQVLYDLVKDVDFTPFEPP
jgi:hypothetical protein